MKSQYALALALAIVACAPGRSDLTILTTTDMHGAWFDSTYVDDATRPSLLAVNAYVDSVRSADGSRNVLLLDAGDCLQGDNAAYYFNYVDTTDQHLFCRMAAYMKYDAICVGNHDIETGHGVYDRVNAELAGHGIPMLAGNAIRNDNGKPYFRYYKVFRKAGRRVLVMGYDNPNIAAWLDEGLWSGMHFESLIPLVQQDVDALSAKLRPDVTVVCVHSGTGTGDGTSLEAQGKDLLQSLRGVDFILCGHDHRQTAICSDSIALINAGNRSRYLGVGKVHFDSDGGKTLSASLLPVDKSKADPRMRKAFQSDYEKVKRFTQREIGVLTQDLYTREAFKGMCPYMNVLHNVQLASSGAQVSFAAPLTSNGKISAGILTFNDLFKIYPYENQLFVLRLSGREIKDYLEYSYGAWLAEPGSGHALGIEPGRDGQRWVFSKPSFNFDSAAGIDYTVDLAASAGQRVCIATLSDGTPFRAEEEYMVAMTSYRANGGGDLIIKGAGIPKEELEGRIAARYPDIRDCILDFIEHTGTLDSATVPAPGGWRFVPDTKQVDADYKLLFGGVRR